MVDIKPSNEQMKKQATGLYKLAELVLSAIDARTGVALMMLMLALGMISAPEAGAASSLAALGISPKGFAYGCGLAAGIILRYPKTPLYTLLISPLTLYIIALVHYIGTQPVPSVAPLAWYFGFFFLALKAGQEKRSDSGL